METLLQKAFSADAFRTNGHKLIDLLADRLANSQNTTQPFSLCWQEADNMLEYWKQDAQKPLLEEPFELFSNILSHSINLYSKSTMGHQVPPPAPHAVLGTLLTAFLNNGSAVYEMGMTGNALEKMIIAEMAKTFGLGDDVSGFITSGGTLGNLTALLCARAVMQDAGDDDNSQLAALVSVEAHYSVERAMRVMGYDVENVIKVPVNEHFQIRTDLLEEYYEKAVAAGKKVFCIIGCACSTSTGSYDDLEALALFAKKHNLWFHVDGAHGAAAVYSPKYKHLLNGIEHADSIIVDFHKMMCVPSLSTAVIFRRPGDSYKTFAQKAQYLWADQEKKEWQNSGKRTFECTKPMTVVSIYTLMRMYGNELFKENVETLCALAAQFAALVTAHPHFELAVQPQSNIVCFRYIAAGNLDDINKRILQHLVREGKYYITGTTLNNSFCLRTAIMNPLTGITEFEGLLEYIQQVPL